MNSNGYITAPISLKDDVYTVLGISPSGAYYDLAEACTSNNINKWAKHKPYITEDNSYEPISYNLTYLKAQDGKVNKASNGFGVGFVDIDGVETAILTDMTGSAILVTKDPSKQGSAATYWGLLITAPNQSGKNIRDWMLSMAPPSSSSWYYVKPQKTDTNWKRLTDFEYYNHKAQAPLSITPYISKSGNTLASNQIINLFPSGGYNTNIIIDCSTPGGSGSFNSVLEFYQRRPELRLAVEMWPQSSVNNTSGNTVTVESWAGLTINDDEMLGKLFFPRLIFDPNPKLIMNVNANLSSLFGQDSFWHMGGSKYTTFDDAFKIYYMFALQETNDHPTTNPNIYPDKMYLYCPGNKDASISSGMNSEIVKLDEDPSLAGSAVLIPLYNMPTGIITTQALRYWPVAFGCWFDRKLTNVKWGFLYGSNVNGANHMWYENEKGPSSLTGIVNSDLFVLFEIETNDEAFTLESGTLRYNGNSVKFGALEVSTYNGNSFPIIADIIANPNILNGEWIPDSAQSSTDSLIVQTSGSETTGKQKIYLRFKSFWQDTNKMFGSGCKIRLMVSLADNPNLLESGSGDYLKNWIDVSSTSGITMADGTSIDDSIINTNVYYNSQV